MTISTNNIINFKTGDHTFRFAVKETTGKGGTYKDVVITQETYFSNDPDNSGIFDNDIFVVTHNIKNFKGTEFSAIKFAAKKILKDVIYKEFKQKHLR